MFKYMLASLFMLLFILESVSAQSSKFEFDFQQMIGNLEEKDQQNESMGLYDGYEIPLYEGESVQFLLYTEDFDATFLLVDPEGKTFKQSLGQKNLFTRISGVIPKSGNWYLYVACKSKGKGQYFLQNAIGPESAFSIAKNAEFCDKLSFILAHARASFQLLGDEKGSKVEFGEELKRYLDTEDGSYHAILYEGKKFEEANAVRTNWIKKVVECLGENWERKELSWTDVGDFRVLDILLTGKDLLGNKLQIVNRISELKDKFKDPARTTSMEAIFKIIQ